MRLIARVFAPTAANDYTTKRVAITAHTVTITRLGQKVVIMTDFALTSPKLPERERKQGTLELEGGGDTVGTLRPEVLTDCRVCKLVYPGVWESCSNRLAGASGCRQIL